jgi:hypothetical protein
MPGFGRRHGGSKELTVVVKWALDNICFGSKADIEARPLVSAPKS